jgi:acyl dehydratase
MATKTLGGAPGARTLYPRAVLGSLPRPLLRSATLPDHEFELADVTFDAGHVADYARVCGFGLRNTLPPTYLHVLAFCLAMRLMTDSAFPFGVLGLVHVANRIEHRRPVVLAETPTLRVHAADLRDHPRGRQFDVIARAHVGDEVVWEGRSTYLRAGGASTGKDDKKRGRAEAPEPQAILDVPGDIGRRYGAVSGDRNPIHLHGLTARLFGQSGAIAHGMWLKARCLAALQPALPDAFAVEVAFKRPVPLPSKVGFSHGDATFAVHGTRTPVAHLEGRIGPP